MKVHAYLLCFNEEQIIRHTIEHYREFCSRIFVMDNMSTDASVDIARSYDEVEIIPWDSRGLFDELLLTRMRSQTYRQYSRKGGAHTTEVADWIISCDMDELVYHPEIAEVLGDYSEMGVTVPQITGFNVVGDRDVQPAVPLIEQYPLGVRSPDFDKRVLFDADFDMSYSPGSHPRGAGFEHMKATYGYRTSNKHQIALLHYKHVGGRLYQTAERILARMPEGSVTRTAQGEYRGLGAHYRKLVEEGHRVSPFLEKATDLFGPGGSVRFSAFPATTGENGALPPGASRGEVSLPERDVDFLRDTAIGLEDTDLEAALRLMLIAQAARPSGPFIGKKVEEYRRRLGSV